MQRRVLIVGVLFWLAGTITVRLGGQQVFRRPPLVLYAVSFAALTFLTPQIFRRLGIAPEGWPQAATILMLPTLLLDPFSCAFFPLVFPNVHSGAAGVFGGWMLMCCGGAAVGAWLPLARR